MRKFFFAELDNDPQNLCWANPHAYGSLSDLQQYSEEELPDRLYHLREEQENFSYVLAQQDSVMAINLRTLNQSGVNVAVGTDAGNIGTMHATSYMQELRAMQQAGLNNGEVLKAATINGATCFGLENRLGTVSKGKIADLLLLEKNPLEDIENLHTTQYIIKSGKLMKPDTLIQESPEAIVQRQLNAYNARNIDAFLDTYADSIRIYDFPHEPLMQGKEELKEQYTKLFSEAPNLYAEVKERIIMDNKIIDQEHVRAGEDYIDAVAIYEIEDGKIAQVTFIRNVK